MAIERTTKKTGAHKKKDILKLFFFVYSYFFCRCQLDMLLPGLFSEISRFSPTPADDESHRQRKEISIISYLLS